MPYAFVEIEKQKKWIIRAILIFLIVFYFLVAEVLWLITKILFAFHSGSLLEGPLHLFSFQESVFVFAVAFAAALIHWYFSTQNMISKILSLLGAVELDPKDSYHQVLKNVIEEVSVATGGTVMRGCVLPIIAMNAFAISDFSGNATIGITEGLLAKLNRSQLEAVIAHEAAHIASQDSLTTTIACSLSGVYSALLENISKALSQGRGSRIRGGGRMTAFLVVVYIVLLIAQFINTLLNMFLSRQKEYRADAVSVRLTRNPISLAEALYIVSRNWRGVGGIAGGLSPIFIMSPDYNGLEEREGIISDVFSTHPPVRKRLSVLLDMAHCDITALKKGIRPKEKISSVEGMIELKEEPKREWLIYKDSSWQGPFGLEELFSLNLSHDSWVSRVDEGFIKYASDDEELRQVFISGIKDKADLKEEECPECKIPLGEALYEGAPLLKCHSCEGVFVGISVSPRILAREDFMFDSSIKEKSEKILKLYFKGEILRKDTFKTAYELTCPKCKEKMRRGFFSYAYPIEVDRCDRCQYVWFNRGELETLQYLSEKFREEKF